MLRRARVVLGLVTTLGGSTVPVVIQAHSAWPSLLGRCNEYCRRFRPPLGRNGEFCVTVGPVIRTAGIRAYCMLAQLGLTLPRSKVKGDELPRNGPHIVWVNLFTSALGNFWETKDNGWDSV